MAAVITPAALLSVTPAFAGTASATSAEQTQDHPTIAQLEKAAAEAKKAYDDAVIAEKAAYQAASDILDHPGPADAKYDEAKKAATAAATAKTTADKALADAKAALAALPGTATEADKAAAQQTVTDTEAAAKAAADAKTAADAVAAAAHRAADDVRVAALQRLSAAQKVTKKALAAKTAADKALADAKANQDCVPQEKFTAVAKGLPSKIVAGTWTGFSIRVTNGTPQDVDGVVPVALFHAMDNSGTIDYDKLIQLQWFDVSATSWKSVGGDHAAGLHTALKAGAHLDVKLRVKVDAKVTSGSGIAFVAGAYANKDGSCGGTPDANEYTFTITAAGSNPGDVGEAKPSKVKPTLPAPKPQGGSSDKPVTTPSGSLARTGSSSAVPQLALAGGAAVAVGAGAMFVVRRRRSAA